MPAVQGVLDGTGRVRARFHVEFTDLSARFVEIPIGLTASELLFEPMSGEREKKTSPATF